MKKLLDFVALLGARLSISFVGRLPRSLGLFVTKTFVSLLRAVMPKLSRTVRRNLDLVFPEKSVAERAEIHRRSFEMLATTLYDSFFIPRVSAEWVEKHCEAQALREVIAAARARTNGTGILICAVHFGSFELLFQAYAYIDRPVSVLARGFGFPKLDEWWTRRREIHGHRVFPRKGGYREIVRRLKEGKDVVVLFDQNVKRKHATFVDLFGIPAATTKSVGLAAIETECPVLFVTGAQTAPGRYTFIAREIPNPAVSGGSFRDQIIAVMRNLHEALEDVVRQYPEQWFWIHRRFKTRPLGELETLYSA